MSLYDKSSLVLIPSGTKTGKVFSQKPVSGDGDFTFTRASAATRVNADGNIEKETQNLLTHSGDLTNADWSIVNSATYNGTETDPNGGSKAYSFTGGSTNSAVRQTNSLSGGVYTFSVYLKSPTSAPINIRLDSNNGTFENYPCALTTAWQRFEFYYVHNSSTLSAWIGGGLSWTTGEEVHIAFPQLEQGLVARDYIETTTTAVYGGITDNTPRLDYTDSSCPALLLEPLRTNNIAHSEYLVGISAVNATTSANETISPDGGNNATKLSALISAPSSQWARYYNIVQPNQKQALSIYAKAGNIDDFTITYYDQSTGDLFFNYDLGAGSVSAPTGNANYVDADIQDLGNGWYRCIAVVNAQAAGTNGQFQVSAGVQRVVQNIGDYVYIYGYQWEQNVSYATSYIPTYGSSVSRVDDLFDLRDVQTNGLVTSTQGTMFFHITDIAGTAVVYNIQTLNDLSYALRFVIRQNGYVIYQRVNNVQTILRSTTLLSLSEWKVAMSWNGTSLITSLNGTSYVDTIDASIASQLDKIARVNPQAISVTTNQILVFPTQLTEAELNALTTI
jgi:hypothetical protein